MTDILLLIGIEKTIFFVSVSVRVQGSDQTLRSTNEIFQASSLDQNLDEVRKWGKPVSSFKIGVYFENYKIYIHLPYFEDFIIFENLLQTTTKCKKLHS